VKCRDCIPPASPKFCGNAGNSLQKHLKKNLPVWHGTTILDGVRKGGKGVVIRRARQVSLGRTVIKSNAKKGAKTGQGASDRRLCRGHRWDGR